MFGVLKRTSLLYIIVRDAPLNIMKLYNMKAIILLLLLSGCSTVPTKVEALTHSVFKLEVYNDSVLRGNGTAFSVRNKGDTTLLITNKHACFKDATYLLVDTISQKYPATFVYSDPVTDLCMLKTLNKFDVLPISNKNSATGDKVFTIGAPLGFFPTYEYGTVLTPPIVLRYNEQGIPYKVLGQTIGISTDHGGSGSPVIVEDKVVGVLFATTGGKLSYMIAATQLNSFILNSMME